MLQSLELENFKAFGSRTKISFAPITLIFGENSAGKSSILQALNLLKQTRKNREAGALLLPRAEEGIVDLGSFQEFLFDHDLQRPLSIRVATTTDRDRTAIELTFRRPSIDEEVLLDQIEIFSLDPYECIARFQSTKMPQNIQLDLFTEFPRNARAAKCIWINNRPEYWISAFKWCRENRQDIVNRLEDRVTQVFLRDLKLLIGKLKTAGSSDELKSLTNILRDIARSQEMPEADYEDEAFLKYFFEEESDNEDEDFVSLPGEKPIGRDELKEAIEFYSSDFALEAYIKRMLPRQLNTIVGIDGFIPIRVLQGAGKPFPEQIVYQSVSQDQWTLNVGRLALAAGTDLERTLWRLFPLGSLRRPPERWYVFTGTNPQDVGYRGDLLPDLLFRHPKLVKEANAWLERLGISYQLKLRSLGLRSEDLFEVRLVDTYRRTPVEVGLPDVGFGISQLLPFVVQSLLSEGQIISIEQPEIHIHPKLQADLGDLLAEAIKEPRSNQFIIETHSEHLILRLQRLVREEVLQPTDVSIVYVSRGSEGSTAQRLHLDEEGDFVDDWPGGFFPERLRELR